LAPAPLADPPGLGALHGIGPSLNTPFDDASAVDTVSLGRLCEATIDAGCAGMLAIAVAGEQASLTEMEKKMIVGRLADANAGRIPLIVSVTHEDPAVSGRLAAMARAAGADGICCQAPASATLQETAAMLQSVADAGPDLLMVQDLDWQGGGLAVDAIAALFGRITRFRSLKIETVNPGPKYSAVLAATGGALHVAGGWAVREMPDALARGVHAFMPTAMDPIYVAIDRAFRDGDEAGARALFDRLAPVLDLCNTHIDVSIRFLKMLRHREGVFATDHCRPPVPDFDPEMRARADSMIDRVLALEAEIAAGHR